MTATMKILIKRRYAEDTVKRLLCWMFMPEPVWILAKKILEITVPDSCCGCPVQKGQSVKISTDCRDLLIDGYTKITYNLQSNQWEIFLPTRYVSNPIEDAKSDGFREYSVIKGDPRPENVERCGK